MCLARRLLRIIPRTDRSSITTAWFSRHNLVVNLCNASLRTFLMRLCSLTRRSLDFPLLFDPFLFLECCLEQRRSFFSDFLSGFGPSLLSTLGIHQTRPGLM